MQKIGPGPKVQIRIEHFEPSEKKRELFQSFPGNLTHQAVACIRIQTSRLISSLFPSSCSY